jgi:hypothetical protein
MNRGYGSAGYVKEEGTKWVRHVNEKCIYTLGLKISRKQTTC